MSTTAAKHGAGPVPDLAICTLPHLRAWREYAGVSRPALARQTGISPSMLVVIELYGQRTRGRFVNRIAGALAVPAPVLMAYAPLDPQARRWATKVAASCAARRLASVS